MTVTADLSGLFLFFINDASDASHIVYSTVYSNTNWLNVSKEMKMHWCFAYMPMYNKQSIHHKDYRMLIYNTVKI